MTTHYAALGEYITHQRAAEEAQQTRDACLWNLRSQISALVDHLDRRNPRDFDFAKAGKWLALAEKAHGELLAAISEANGRAAEAKQPVLRIEA